MELLLPHSLLYSYLKLLKLLFHFYLLKLSTQISLEAQHPNFVATEYFKATCLFVAIGTFASYEIFFFPSYLNRSDDVSRKKIKMIFVSYHIPWSLMITYIALLDGTAWNAWISVGVMYGFTLWGAIAKS